MDEETAIYRDEEPDDKSLYHKIMSADEQKHGRKDAGC